MTNESAFLALPQDFKGITLVYPPKVKDIVGNRESLIYRKMFTITQEEIEDEYTKNNKDATFPTPLEYLLATSYNDVEFERMAKSAFYFFTRQDATFLYEQKAILLGDLKEIDNFDIEHLPLITEDNYFDFQNEIRRCLGEPMEKPPEKNLHPKIKRMKALARLRDRIKAKTGAGSIDLLTTLCAICCMGIGITPLNIGEISYASLKYLMAMYQNKEKYHIDVATLQAGGDSKKIKPKYWVENFN